jgi:predicted DNA-binding transcriptional regulator AlpA
MSTTQPDFLRRRDCAARCGINKSTWLRWEAKGLAPKARRISDKVIGITRAEFEAWLASRQQVGA